MNQIPNIEETHSTREVEGMMDKFLDAEIKWVDIENGLGKYMLASQVIEQARKVFAEYQESLHHQLQKAREENADKLYGEGYYNGVMCERERIEAIFKEHVPPHAMDLEDSVWLKRLLNKAFNHNQNV